MNKKLLLLIASFSISVLVFSQTIVQPNYGLKSHPTLEIQSIVISPAATTVFMVIENRVLDGSFCADKNIYIVAENGKHIKLISAEGIPVCPDSYKFNNFGDKLHFSLVFPPLPLETKWIDLIEDCNDACFSFNGVVIDEGLNQKINRAYSFADAGKIKEAYQEFINILPEFSGKNSGYEGAVYWNLIDLSRKSGDTSLADEWLMKLKSLDIPEKNKYLQSLNLK